MSATAMYQVSQDGVQVYAGTAAASFGVFTARCPQCGAETVVMVPLGSKGAVCPRCGLFDAAVVWGEVPIPPLLLAPWAEAC